MKCIGFLRDARLPKKLLMVLEIVRRIYPAENTDKICERVNKAFIYGAITLFSVEFKKPDIYF